MNCGGHLRVLMPGRENNKGVPGAPARMSHNCCRLLRLDQCQLPFIRGQTRRSRKHAERITSSILPAEPAYSA